MFNYLKSGLIIIFCLEILAYFIYIPLLKKQKVKQAVRGDGPKNHLKKSGTPTMGGLIFGIFIILGYIGGLKLLNVPINTKTTLIIMISLIGYGLLGFIDDYLIVVKKNNLGLKANIKFIIQLVLASFIYLILLINHHPSTINIFGYIIDLSFMYGVFLMFFFSATTNSVNLSDGLDGLASGIIVTILIGCMFLGYFKNNTEVVVLSLVSIVSLLAFMFFNLNPAKIFMGNVGSMFLGGLLSIIFVILECEILLIVMGLILVIETLSDIIQVTYFKYSKGKRIFKMAPIHHHLELLEYSEWQIDLIFWAFSLVMSLLGVIMGVQLF
ncbi:MAG: phospho-N-acetylmuramoyl-pentapeptide-transferase [Bacilli bacterium]|nr:phospho-N-acetylmuramoyl-pentapeptide-transferase [Bacilli bacterium]